MNKVIVMMTLKQLWSRKVRILLVVFFIALPLLMDSMFQQVQTSDRRVISEWGYDLCVPLLVLTIGAGMVGQDISDGILPSIFSRPVKRWTYVFSKWLTVSSLAATLSVVSVGCHFLFNFYIGHDLEGHVLQAVSKVVLTAFGATSVLLLLSSLLPGLSDAGVLLLVSVGNAIMHVLGASYNVPGLMETANTIASVIFPSFNYIYVRSLQSLFSIEVGRYFAIVLVSLSVSVLLVKQKELSYGSN